MKRTRKEYKTLIEDRIKMKNRLQRLEEQITRWIGDILEERDREQTEYRRMLKELAKRICILEEQLAVRKGKTKADGEAEGLEEAEKSRPLSAPELYDCREDLPVY
ncbi:hypothetical protein [Wansuia hejianensis]|uniref:Uncharacterized protein n=1 Tax=Wansuia hejianensis TaxID=2763667 RepID=A0A7G9GB51_9FIRM|nr:hypothetical protein [Wansuia hejianensis]QNM08033.1 hypothetical protein H9Q79_14230 [Wansuia hejianensis]